jgi:ankyrin repeat protein
MDSNYIIYYSAKAPLSNPLEYVDKADSKSFVNEIQRLSQSSGVTYFKSREISMNTRTLPDYIKCLLADAKFNKIKNANISIGIRALHANEEKQVIFVYAENKHKVYGYVIKQEADSPERMLSESMPRVLRNATNRHLFESCLADAYCCFSRGGGREYVNVFPRIRGGMQPENAYAYVKGLQLALLKKLASEGNVNELEQLFRMHVPIDLADAAGCTALFWAIINRQQSVIQLILNEGANVNVQTNLGYTILHVAAHEGCAQVIEGILACKANIEAKQNEGYTALHLASKEGHLDVVTILIQNGACIESLTNNGLTPLCLAVHNGHAEIVDLLLFSGANNKVKVVSSLLSLAIYKNRIEVVKVLLKHKIDVEARDAKGWTALHLAAQENRSIAIELLFEAGADIEAKTPDGHTALHLGIQFISKDAVSTLLKCKADINAKTIDGLTALELAQFFKDSTIINLLQDLKL